MLPAEMLDVYKITDKERGSINSFFCDLQELLQSAQSVKEYSRVSSDIIILIYMLYMGHRSDQQWQKDKHYWPNQG